MTRSSEMPSSLALLGVLFLDERGQNEGADDIGADSRDKRGTSAYGLSQFRVKHCGVSA